MSYRRMSDFYRWKSKGNISMIIGIHVKLSNYLCKHHMNICSQRWKEYMQLTLVIFCIRAFHLCTLREFVKKILDSILNYQFRGTLFSANAFLRSISNYQLHITLLTSCLYYFRCSIVFVFVFIVPIIYTKMGLQ